MSTGSLIPGPWVFACFVSALCMPGLFLGFWAAGCHRRRTALEITALRQEIETSAMDCRRDVERISHGFEQLESGMCSSEELLSSGRLNRSARARALQLLRAGISPDNAASTVGLAKSEMRLLAHVSRILANP